MQLTPPTLTLASRLLIRWMEATNGWSRARAAAISASAFAAIALLEYCGGAMVSVGVFYFVACAFAVWCLGERLGLVVSTAGALASAVIKHEQLHHVLAQPITPAAEAWSFFARLLTFGLFAVIVSGLRCVLAVERWQAAHDGLTGALNKSAFEREVAERVARAAESTDRLLFAFMDLDGFKALNDRNGHAAGDRVLCTFAAAAIRAMRAGDLFARVGGDEFALVLRLPREVDGGRVASLLHARLTTILESTGLPVTCSMGAVLADAGQLRTGQDFVEQADMLMYEAKHAGRNRLRIAGAAVLGATLRQAFPPPATADGELDELLAKVNLVDRRRAWFARDAA